MKDEIVERVAEWLFSEHIKDMKELGAIIQTDIWSSSTVKEYWKAKAKELLSLVIDEEAELPPQVYQAELRGIRKGAWGVVDMIRTSNKLAGFKNRIEISNNIVIELREQGIERLDDD